MFAPVRISRYNRAVATTVKEEIKSYRLLVREVVAAEEISTDHCRNYVKLNSYEEILDKYTAQNLMSGKLDQVASIHCYIDH
jgi:hypothetical protein